MSIWRKRGLIQNKFTPTAKNVLKGAASEAGALGHTYIGTEHLLLAMTKDNESVGGGILLSKGLEHEPLKRLVREISGTGERTSPDSADMTPALRRIIEGSSGIAEKYGHALIGTEDLLLAMIQEKESVAVKLMIAQNISINELQNDIVSFFGDIGGDTDIMTKKQKGSLSVLGQYGRDLTAYASMGLLDPIIGREQETERVIQILSRRTKNNPCLIGEPGVGKTAVVEGLAERIAHGAVPDNLSDKTVIALDISAMIAGAKYRGEFEDRLKKVMDEVMKNRNIILFIDEIHTIVGAGAAEGAVDAANILKPALARGELQLIGATTTAEFRRHIEKDAALERRFQSVLVEEPTPEETLAILKGLRFKYETHHKIVIPDEALEAAIRYSVRYIPERFLPDKAIDLIDEAASKKRLTNYSVSPAISACESEIRELTEGKEHAIREQKFDLAMDFRERLGKAELALKEEKGKIRKEKTYEHIAISADDIADVVTAWTKIPVKQLVDSAGDRLLHLEELLGEQIVGQERAVSAVSRAIRRGRVGLGDPLRPICSLLFMGPTGVGKTELAASVASIVFGSEKALIRLDMSEYMEKHSVSKMIGSPPGYVGYDEGGGLTEKVRRLPYSVVLFDEIEKAHPDIFGLLLQILDNGILTDSSGHTANFKNTIIILTTNIGSDRERQSGVLGFSAQKESIQEREQRMKSLREYFRPEMINRIDEIVVFDSLSRDSILAIARKMLVGVSERIRSLGVHADFDESVSQMLADCDDISRYGARPLRREIFSKIEDVFSLWMLDGKLVPGDCITVSATNGFISFEKQNSDEKLTYL